jgi:Domain of unknown function (DUF4129)
MRAARMNVVLAIALCSLGLAQSQTPTVPTFVRQPRELSLNEYISELGRLSTLVPQGSGSDAVDEAIASLSGGWKVVANGITFNIQTDELLDGFEKLKKRPDDRIRDHLLQQLSLLKADAEAFEQAPPDSTAARRMLTEILARSEFRSVHGPTWLDRLKYRIVMWIIRLLTHTFGSSAVPTIGRVLVWALVAIAVTVLAYFIYRTIRVNVRVESVIPEDVPVSAKQWRLWMDEAQAAAAQGHWREAVHLAYWAGISFLEQAGMWRPDKARTPREYLRLLPAESERRAPLSALTRNLEVTWYGNQPAGPETFSETVSLLEALGCRQP